MRLSWAVLGLSWGPLGPSWSGLGSLLGSLGASESRNSEKAKNIEKTNENQRFWPLGPLLGGILKALGASWGPTWAVLGPSWASWSPLGTSWGPPGGIWGRLGSNLGRPGALSSELGALLATRPRPGPPMGENAWAPRGASNPGYIYIYIYIWARGHIGPPTFLLNFITELLTYDVTNPRIMHLYMYAHIHLRADACVYAYAHLPI